MQRMYEIDLFYHNEFMYYYLDWFDMYSAIPKKFSLWHMSPTKKKLQRFIRDHFRINVKFKKHSYCWKVLLSKNELVAFKLRFKENER